MPKKPKISLPPASLLNQDAFLLKADRLLSKANNSPQKKADVITELCEALINMTPVKQNIFINEISLTHKIPKKLFNEQIKSLRKEISDKDKLEEIKKDSTPPVTLLENFIANHYNIKYNIISNKFECRETVKKGETENEYENLTEYNILRKLRKAFFKTSYRELIETIKSDFTKRYNPFFDYFFKLPKWDGVDHIDKLAEYLTIPDKKRFDVQFRKLFVRMIACMMEINFNKQGFIFVGKGSKNQDMGKSTLIRWLIPPKLHAYYTEDVPKDKDALIALCENMLINLDELAAFTKMEITQLKSAMSKDMVKVRIPFDKGTSLLKRRCNFMGSTNEPKILTDLTGNVRWVVFYITDIDFDYMKDVDIDMIWSQAYHYLKNGIDGKPFIYQLTRAEILENERVNLEFMNLPPEMDLIPKNFKPGTKDYHDEFFTASDIVKELSIITNHTIKFYVNNIGKALRKLGFEQSEKKSEIKDYQIKGYYIKYTESSKYKLDTEKDEPF